MSGRFLKAGALAFVVSVGLGLFMGIGGNRDFVSLHAHVALSGWVSMALFAIAYRLWPRLGAGWLAPAHYWLYTLGFLVSMTGLALLESGQTKAGEPLAGIGSVVTVLGVLAFAAQVLRANFAAGDD